VSPGHASTGALAASTTQTGSPKGAQLGGQLAAIGGTVGLDGPGDGRRSCRVAIMSLARGSVDAVGEGGHAFDVLDLCARREVRLFLTGTVTLRQGSSGPRCPRAVGGHPVEA
jgi:hypothetical protein